MDPRHVETGSGQLEEQDGLTMTSTITVKHDATSRLFPSASSTFTMVLSLFSARRFLSCVKSIHRRMSARFYLVQAKGPRDTQHRIYYMPVATAPIFCAPLTAALLDSHVHAVPHPRTHRTHRLRPPQAAHPEVLLSQHG